LEVKMDIRPYYNANLRCTGIAVALQAFLVKICPAATGGILLRGPGTYLHCK
jgi:hypothetical protein